MNGANFLANSGASSSQPRGAKRMLLMSAAARPLKPGLEASDGHASRICASPSCGGMTPVTGDFGRTRAFRAGLLGATAVVGDGSTCGAAVKLDGEGSCSMSTGMRGTEA